MNKICTTIEQSQKLIELGIDVNTADMYWWYSGKIHYVEAMDDGDFNKESDIPAWSLSALLELLSFPNLFYNDGWNLYVTINDKTVSINNADNPIDAAFEMIVKLKEQNLI